MTSIRIDSANSLIRPVGELWDLDLTQFGFESPGACDFNECSVTPIACLGFGRWGGFALNDLSVFEFFKTDDGLDELVKNRVFFEIPVGKGFFGG